MAPEILDILENHHSRPLRVDDAKNFVKKIAPVVVKTPSKTRYAEGLTGETSAKKVDVGKSRAVHLPYVARGSQTVIGLVNASNAFVYIARKDAIEFGPPLECLMKSPEATKKIGVSYCFRLMFQGNSYGHVVFDHALGRRNLVVGSNNLGIDLIHILTNKVI